MGLKIWLPLNKNINNYGITQCDITNNNATLNNYAYYFDGYSYINVSQITIGTIATFAWWAKTNENSQFWVLNAKIYSQFCFWLNGSHYYLYPNTPFYNNGLQPPAFKDNLWHHYILVFNGASCILYIDGNYYGTANEYISPETPINSYIKVGGGSYQYTPYGLNGYLFDFRIYDHVLSKKEINELSRGCILHYPCNDINSQVMNNVFEYPTFNTSDSSGGWNHSSMGTGTGYSQNTNKDNIYSIHNIEGSNFPVRARAHYVYCNSGAVPITVYQTPSYVNSTGYRSVQAIIKMSDGSVPNESKVKWTWGGNYGVEPQNQYIPLGDGFYLMKCEGLQQTQRDTASQNRIGITVLSSISHGYAVYISEAYCENDVQVCSNIWHKNNFYYLKDISGFDNHSTISGSLPLLSTPKSIRYDKCINIDNSGSDKNFANCTINAPQIKSASFWLYIGANNPISQILFVDLDSNMGFGFNSNGNIITHTGDTSISALFFGAITLKNSWNHFVVNHLGTSTELYLNGTKLLSIGNEVWLNENWGFYFGKRARINSENYYNGYVSNFRLFTRTLTQSDVDDLYKNSLVIDKSQNSYTYELNESDLQTSVGIKKSGQLLCKNYSETLTSLYDDNIYIEPDGSVWIRIFHHNNPANSSNRFGQPDSFITKVYKNENTWFNVAKCNLVNKWELMVKQKAESSSTEEKFRWIQNANPMTATFSDIIPNAITPIIGNGYTSFNGYYGGIYAINNGSTYLAQQSVNGGSTTWRAGIGQYNIQNGGISAFCGQNSTTIITTGYLDLYLCIHDSLNFIDFTQNNQIVCIRKNGVITTKEIYEI